MAFTIEELLGKKKKPSGSAAVPNTPGAQAAAAEWQRNHPGETPYWSSDAFEEGLRSSGPVDPGRSVRPAGTGIQASAAPGENWLNLVDPTTGASRRPSLFGPGGLLTPTTQQGSSANLAAAPRPVTGGSDPPRQGLTTDRLDRTMSPTSPLFGLGGLFTPTSRPATGGSDPLQGLTTTDPPGENWDLTRGKEPGGPGDDSPSDNAPGVVTKIPTLTTPGTPATPTTPTTPGLLTPPNGDWATWFRSITHGAGLAANPDTLLSLAPVLTQYGVTVLRNASGRVSGKIRLPDGRVIDVGRAFGAGGGGPDFWQWLEDSGEGSQTSEGKRGGKGDLFNDFEDPWGQAFEDAIEDRLNSLNAPVDRTQLQNYLSELLNAIKNKRGNVADLVEGLRGRAGELRDPNTEYTGALRERAGELRDPNATPLSGALRSRIEELRLDPYTDQQEAAIRAKAFDTLERRRAETLKNRREQVYARGFEPSSGVVQGAEDVVNTQFEQQRTGIESDLLLNAIDEIQRRRDKALGLEQFFDENFNLKRDQALGYIGDIDENVEGRRDKATQLLALIENALSGADETALGYSSNIADIEDRIYQDDEQRRREELATYGPILDLISQRQQLANQTAGIDASPDSLVGSILSLLSLGNQTRTIGQQRNQNQAAGLGSLFQLLFPSGFGGSGGGR